MPTTVATSIKASVQVTEVSGTASVGGAAPVATHFFDASQDIANGTTSGLADLVWSQSGRVVNNGANDDIDVSGALAVTFGGNFTPVRIVGLYIKNRTTLTGNKLVVGNGANPFFSGLFGTGAHVITVGPGGSLLWTSQVDPATPAGGTGDILRINNPGSAPITYDILIVGRSA